MELCSFSSPLCDPLTTKIPEQDFPQYQYGTHNAKSKHPTALRLYAEAARDSPFDARPRALAYYLCLLTDREEEGKHWNAAYASLVPESEIIDRDYPGDYIRTSSPRRWWISSTSWRSRRVPVACAASRTRKLSAEQDTTLSTAERLHRRVLRAYLHAMRSEISDNQSTDLRYPLLPRSLLVLLYLSPVVD
uniref:Uncharacterized protein n=1 Tax=Oryza punctata TaxID=4537 RepID=A0A0E0JJQ5_ORYPU